MIGVEKTTEKVDILLSSETFTCREDTDSVLENMLNEVKETDEQGEISKVPNIESSGYDPDKILDTWLTSERFSLQLTITEESQIQSSEHGVYDNSEELETPITEQDREAIKEETGWSDDVIDALIETKTTRGQYEVYRNAGLHECIINGRLCLCKEIDMEYVDEKTGMTNRELMEKGRSPIDSKTGEKIELHHMGQDYDGPLVELNENSEHGDGNHKTLHPKHDDSFRQDPSKEYAYNYEKIQYWKTRSTERSEV